MTFDDFKTNFQRCEICYLGPDSEVEGLEEGAEDQINKWESTLCEGSWIRNVNAGGCKNYSCKYARTTAVLVCENYNCNFARTTAVSMQELQL